MEKLIPWSQWVGIVQPHYYKGERGNKPYDLELMLRIYVLQHLYNLADDAARNEIIDSRAFSQFCGVDSSNQVPDGDTIGRFRHILERNQLGEAFFTNVVESLQKCNLMLKKGTIVDSTLIAAPSSTKNKEKQRDPEAHSVKKRQLVVLRLQGAHRRGCGQRTGSHGGNDSRQCARQQYGCRASSRNRGGSLW